MSLVSPELWDFAAFGLRRPTSELKVWTPQLQSVHHKSDAPDIVPNNQRTNAFGLTDMVGNVWEWCMSWENHPYLTMTPGDTTPWLPELRGGGFLDDISKTDLCLKGFMLEDREHTRHSDIGFRVAVMIPLEKLPEALQTRLETCDPFGKL